MTQRFCRSRRLAFSSVLVLLTCHSALANDTSYAVAQRLVLSGETAPGITPVAPWTHLSPPVINDAGRVVFEGLVQRSLVGAYADAGIWAWDAAQGTSLVVQEGSTDDFRLVRAPRLTPACTVVFNALDIGGAEAIWQATAGAFTRIAGLNEQLPPYGNSDVVDWLSAPVVFTGGVSFHSSWYDVASDSFQIWTTRGGALDLLLPPGTSLPGADGETGRPMSLSACDSGAHAVAIQTYADRYTGVWREEGGSLRLVAQLGQVDPANALLEFAYRSFSSLSISDGATAFAAVVEEADAPDPERFRGVWMENAHGLQRLALEHAAAPQVDSGVFRFLSRPYLLDNDEAVLTAALTGEDIDESNNTAIWRGTPDDLQMIAREGEHIPGLASDVVVRDFQAIAVNEDYAALYVTLFGYTVGDNDRALILIDPDGDKHLVTRVGDKFDVAGDGTDLRSVKHIGMLPADPERGRSPLNASGTVAFLLEFFDGSSGVFTAHLVTPCPGDIDGDDDTDQSDLGLLLASYEVDPNDPYFNEDADLNGDGLVDQQDLGILLADYECDPNR